MQKDASDPDTFTAKIYLNRTKPHEFKFIVDGVWRCSSQFETHVDGVGNVNNSKYILTWKLIGSFMPCMMMSGAKMALTLHHGFACWTMSQTPTLHYGYSLI